MNPENSVRRPHKIVRRPISERKAAILNFIRKKPGLSISMIANCLRLNHHNVNKYVKTLFAEDLVYPVEPTNKNGARLWYPSDKAWSVGYLETVI